MTSARKKVKSKMNEIKSLFYILLILALVYFPFANKAFNVDDTLFIKAAEQILVTPLDFYGGEFNWYGDIAPHYEINKNPPFVSYMIAAVASVFGFNEIALHIFFFLPLALSAIGIYLLGHQFNTDPVLTTILATLTPVFLVHGTNLMSDSTMLMFWIWGLVFWMNGIRSNGPKWFFFAGISITFGILTKYTCIFLLPLMIFSGVWQYRKPGLWLVAVFIPLVTMFGFEYYTHMLYGKGLFTEAFIYANDRAPKTIVNYIDNTLTGISFLGGCFPIALLLTPWTGGRLLRLASSIFATGAITVIIFHLITSSYYINANEVFFDINLIIQLCAFSLAGIFLVMACLQESSKGFNHDSIFLLLWFFGILVFVCYLNWTINARSIILLVPVVGLLLTRRFKEWGVEHRKYTSAVLYSMIVLAGLVTVTTTYADYVWANTARLAAKEITSKYNNIGAMWFQGHWGFQYYMENSGARLADTTKDDIQSGDFLIIPLNNTNTAGPTDDYDLVEVMQFSHNSYVATMNSRRGTGFYSSRWGSAPYRLMMPQKENYKIFKKR